jgi:hypothetical protein
MRLVACATAGPRGSPHVDAVESHQLYLPGVPPGPLRCAAARPYECGTNGRLANPAKRTESIHINLFNIDLNNLFLFVSDSHVVRGAGFLPSS